MLDNQYPSEMPQLRRWLSDPGDDWRRPFVKGMSIVLLGTVLFLCLA
jgi:hypothetical protein